MCVLNELDFVIFVFHYTAFCVRGCRICNSKEFMESGKDNPLNCCCSSLCDLETIFPDAFVLKQISLWDSIVTSKKDAKFKLLTYNKYSMIDQVVLWCCGFATLLLHTFLIKEYIYISYIWHRYLFFLGKRFTRCRVQSYNVLACYAKNREDVWREEFSYRIPVSEYLFLTESKG